MSQFGTFSGDPVTRWLPHERRMELQQDFWYDDPQGLRWDAPRGHQVDGASIPPVLWSIAGDPFGPDYRNASIVHDVYCDWGNAGDPRARPWQATHRMFYFACRCGGVGNVRAKLMYAAVRSFGPRWVLGQRTIELAPEMAAHRKATRGSAGQEVEMAAIQNRLERDPGMSLDDIDRMVDEQRAD